MRGTLIKNNLGTPYLSLKEAAQLFGMSRLTVWRWVSSGKLPFTQMGGPHGRIMIAKEDLANLRQWRAPR
jgi:excisionase family DNA binding protein